MKVKKLIKLMEDQVKVTLIGRENGEYRKYFSGQAKYCPIRYADMVVGGVDRGVSGIDIIVKDSSAKVSTPPNSATRNEKDTWLMPKGFLHMRCQHCGKERSFYARSAQSKYKCRFCGEETEIQEELALVCARCDCGEYWEYRTNAKSPEIEVGCLQCKGKIKTVWNMKKGLYETPITGDMQ